ncbi:MAG: M1 family metallopeptidase [Chloroflexota bacterium]|nr:M1 family metallopeptidase [Chloroflexota bacterium]
METIGRVITARGATLVRLAVLVALIGATLGGPVPHALAQAVAVPVGGAAAPARTDTASYDLVARWDPDARQIHGTARITYRNPSSDWLDDVWFKLYLNAFRDPDTVWMREAGAVHRGSAYDPEQPGWIELERLALADTGESVLPPDADADGTVLRVPLPRPIGPGETIRFDVAWTSQLPRVFARTGTAGDFVMAGQWYPKLAVYDRGAWDTEPWHANAEFFADFGSYTLALTVPRDYISAASGVRESVEENDDGTVTVRYHAEAVSDVAWTAWPGYRVVMRTVEAAGRPVELELLTPREVTGADERYFRAAEGALDLLGRWFGPYPWPKLTLVVPPANAAGAGGMEYPSLVTLGLLTELPFGLGSGVREVEIVTVHEIAHQWVPLQVATNEAREAWLDEGFADYATIKVLMALYGGGNSMLDIGPIEVGYGLVHRLQFVAAAATQPLAQPAWEYPNFVAYGATAYSKGALTFQTLKRILGEERFLAAMRGYVDGWRWRHPTTADLQAALEAGAGESLDWFFRPLVYGRGVVEYRVAAADEGGAVIERRGDVAFPVRIRLTYADARSEEASWDGVPERLEVAARGGPLRLVQVDPDRQIAVELNKTDNGLVVDAPPVPILALGARILALVQSYLQLAGTIG